MKQYLIDGLRPDDVIRIQAYLDTYVMRSPVSGIYWLPLEPELLSPMQHAHAHCHPHVFALSLEADRLFCEFLVRITRHIRCDCMAYATTLQRHWLMDQADAILESLDIRI